MNRIECEAGLTQIGRVLAHTIQESEKAPVQALVLIGDAMEEKLEELGGKASELGRKKVPVFAFQEGRDPAAERAFRELVRLTRGAYCRFDPGAAHHQNNRFGSFPEQVIRHLRTIHSVS